MKNIFNSIFALLAGVGCGIFIGYNVAKKRYENLADIEVESVKKFYEKKDNKGAPPSSIGILNKINQPRNNKTKEEEKEMKKYVDYTKKYNTNSSCIHDIPELKKEEHKEEAKKPIGPYMITPAEFNDSFFESRTLFYYADKVLADDDGVIIPEPNINELVGPDALINFGTYEEDAVYIRDDTKGIDYEILLDERSYAKTQSKINPKVNALVNDNEVIIPSGSEEDNE